MQYKENDERWKEAYEKLEVHNLTELKSVKEHALFLLENIKGLDEIVNRSIEEKDKKNTYLQDRIEEMVLKFESEKKKKEGKRTFKTIFKRNRENVEEQEIRGPDRHHRVWLSRIFH